MSGGHDPPLCVALRCAACGRAMSVPAPHLRAQLSALIDAPRPAGALVALACSDCATGGKSEQDGCVVRLRGDVPAFARKQGAGE